MSNQIKIYTLKQLLEVAERNAFAVGAFSPRATAMITPILQAAEAMRSPALVQVAEVEMLWYGTSAASFARQFWAQYEAFKPTVPIGLHLDHTQKFETIVEAVESGFTSVMIDASALPLAENINETRKVVAYAHAHGVSVEAELGRIGSADLIETTVDEELYTDPAEAAYFVAQTGIDALAVSVGTAHGVYLVRQPKVDIERLAAIRALTPVHLVLHGGSGTPAEMIRAAITLPGGGVSKVNIATDLELAWQAELGKTERSSDTAVWAMTADELKRARKAVQAVVEEKMTVFLGSTARADRYEK